MPKIVILLIAVLFVFSGCSSSSSKDNKNQTSTETTKETESTESTTGTETTTQESTIEEPTAEAFTKVDWDTCIQTTKDQFLNNEFYQFVQSIDIEVNNDTKVITFNSVVDDGTEPDVAYELADSIVRYFNLAAQFQDGSVKGSSKDYYGGLYDIYNASVEVMAESDIDDSKKWFVKHVVGRGWHTRDPIELQKIYR